MTTTASQIDYSGEPRQPRPRPLTSVTAAAARIKKTIVRGRGKGKGKVASWQEDAWDMYDLVGEHRFLASTLSNRLSQAHLYVGRLPADPTEDPTPETSGQAYDVFESMAGRGTNFDQVVGRLGTNLFVPGDAYLVGLPEVPKPEGGTDDAAGINPFLGILPDEEEAIDINTLKWSLLSVTEVTVDDNAGTATIKGPNGTEEYDLDEIWLIRVWRPHPRRYWEADSPTRSSLPVLRELVGLTMHISAQIDSRLAGAGLFLIPDSADRAVRAATGADETDPSPLAEALMEAMETAIGDRSAAAAMVPLMSVVPDDSVEKFRFISFSTSLDTEARNLRDEAIRRLALGLDCPPELLLGVGGMNHWGAWLVREDVVNTHIEPPLALICDAITTQFLWPVLEDQGMSAEQAREYVVWYDVDHLITRPNRGEDAKALHAVRAISDSALRDATGFDESDAPDVLPVTEDPAVTAALELAKTAPTLAVNPGLPALVEQIRALYAGTATDATTEDIADALVESEEAPQEEPSTEGGTPATSEDEAPPLAAGGLLVVNQFFANEEDDE